MISGGTILKLSRLLGAAGCAATARDVEITGITADSRAVKKGYLYICIRGGRFDGHSFANEAVTHGAAAVMGEYTKGAQSDLPPEVIVLAAADTRSAASRLWAAWYGLEADGGADRMRQETQQETLQGALQSISHCTRLIAVTGTNGKTSVTHMLRHILRSAGYEVGIIGTVEKSLGEINYDISGDISGDINGDISGGMTTPPPEQLYRIIWDMKRRGADFIIFEASSHGIAQGRLDGLALTGCPLSAAIFTNLSREHLDYHLDMEDYFRVKSRLFTDFEPKISIINTDDKYGERLYNICIKEADGRAAEKIGCPGETPVIGTGIRESGVRAGCEPADAELWLARRPSVRGAQGIEYTFSSPRAVFEVRCPVPGAYTVYNTLEALSCALALGVDPVTAQGAIGVFCGVLGRMERVKCDTTKFTPPVFIDFAHTPAALSELLSSVRAIAPEKRIVLLFGCGGDRDRTKRAEMGKTAADMADLVIITSDNSRSEETADIIAEIERGAALGRAPYIIIPSRADAIEYAVMKAEDRDVILLAGKGHERYEEKNGIRRRFDERELVFAAIDKKYKEY